MPTLHYREPQSRQTLREGIAELRRAEGAQDDAAQNVAPELLDDIDVHDAIHVLFGCSTDLYGEIIAHVWTAFGTTMHVRDMHRVNMHEDHKEALARIGHRRLLVMWGRSLPGVAAAIVAALRMRERWPAEQFERFLDRSLRDIRRAYGIRLPSPRVSASASGGAALRHVRSRVMPIS